MCTGKILNDVVTKTFLEKGLDLCIEMLNLAFFGLAPKEMNLNVPK